MKTPEQMQRLCEFEAYRFPTIRAITAIQADAREGMVSAEVIKDLPALFSDLSQLLDGWRTYKDWTDWDTSVRGRLARAAEQIDNALKEGLTKRGFPT